MTASDFCLPDGYVERLDPVYFDDGGSGNQHDFMSQPDVYDRVAELATVHRADTILDLGCGHADKALAMLCHWTVNPPTLIGVDHGMNMRWLRANRRDAPYRWVNWNLETGLPPIRFASRRTIAVVADVIEHLIDPRPLLADLRAARPAATVITTPARDLTHGPHHLGPPPNDCHVREWTKAELARFLERYVAGDSPMYYTRSDDRENREHTILVEVTDWREPEA